MKLSAKSISVNKIAPTKESKLKKDWNKAKATLLILQELVKNPVVKGVISVVIAAGDALVK